MKEVIGDFESFITNIDRGLGKLGLRTGGISYISVKLYEQPLGVVALVQRLGLGYAKP